MGMPGPTHQAAADGIKALGAYVAVFTGAGGGTNGANEAAGGSYARKQTTWASGTTGIVNGTTQNISVPAGTYTEGGIFSTLTAGTFVGSAPFDAGNVIVSGAGASIDVTPRINS